MGPEIARAVAVCVVEGQDVARVEHQLAMSLCNQAYPQYGGALSVVEIRRTFESPDCPCVVLPCLSAVCLKLGSL
jgi:hypothetical protein